MKSKKFKLSAIVFYTVIIALALGLSNMAFAAQYGDFTYGYDAPNGNVIITKYTGAGGDVVIPSTINGKPVVGIGVILFISLTSTITMGRFILAPA